MKFVATPADDSEGILTICYISFHTTNLKFPWGWKRMYVCMYVVTFMLWYCVIWKVGTEQRNEKR
jgi:uncharacterized membrane protein